MQRVDRGGFEGLREAKPKRLPSRVFALALAGLALCAAPSLAQQLQQPNDIKPLLDRLDQLERDVNLLQRQVYRGDNSGGTPTPPSPPEAEGPTPGPPPGPATLTDEMRISQLEDQMRTLTGQLQEVNFSIDQLKHQVDALSSDVDQRLTQLEHPGAAVAAAGAGAGAAATSGSGAPRPLAPTGPPPPGLTPGTANTSGVLGAVGPGDAQAALPSSPAPPQQASAAPPSPEQQASAASNLPNGTPMEQYQYAFGLLRQAKYPEAEAAFKSFIQHFPNDQLAGSAQYWLGETYYVRQQYKDAATAFAYGYQTYPKSGKGADYLLKLGMSLGSMGEKQDACAAFARLDRDFPSAPGNIKDHEQGERQQLGCP
jgi:tol-pal system protein YbgF